MIARFLALVAGLVVVPIGLISAATAGLIDLPSRSATCIPSNAPNGHIPGYKPDQVENASIIVAVGKQLGVPERGWIIAIATAQQESGLRNLHYGDRDSLGLFQQRPSQGWGTRDQILDPAYSATRFYQRLVTIPKWESMPLTEAAQKVQQSAYPDAYARHEPTAAALVAGNQGATCASPQADPSTWVAPVVGRCTSPMGPRGTEFHRGLDLAAPTGTPIVAASTGTVTDAGPAAGYGLWVRIAHPDGHITTYGHNHRNLVHTGQNVHTGQVIAEVGTQGNSTGPHLHYQIDTPTGTPLDPFAFNRERGVPLCS